MSDQPTPDPVQPTRILTFTGTRDELLDYLNGLTNPRGFTVGGIVEDWAIYEWNLTASIARHPAGKGLGRGN